MLVEIFWSADRPLAAVDVVALDEIEGDIGFGGLILIRVR